MFPQTKSSGFTLVEAIVSMAILAIGFLALASYTVYTSQSQQFIAASSSHNDLIAEIKMAMATEKMCTENITATKITVSELNQQLAFQVWAFNPDGSKRQEIASNQMKYQNKLQIVNLSLVLKQQLDPTHALVHLVVSTDKLGGVLGPKSATSEIPILAVLDAGGTLLTCDTGYDTNGLVNIDPEICSLSSNGTLMYDPASGKCIPTGNCYPGTNANSGTCPTGHAVTCVASGYGLGSVQMVPRKYRNGVQRLGAPPDYIPMVSGNSCTCMYAQNAFPTAGTKCSVCCSTK